MKKYRIGYTDGTYDMFHVGHLNVLETAKQYCDYLIAAVHGDEVVKEYKPAPIIGENERKRIVSAIRYVDQAEITRFRDKRRLWELYHFDVIFIGDDYKGTERWDRFERELKEVGVDVIYIPYTRGISTTKIRQNAAKQETTD